jgi:hypothetical protein
MSKFIGRQQQVGIAREATRGTIVAPSFWVPKTNFLLEDKVLKAPFQGSYGSLAGGDDALVTQQWAEGDLELSITDKVIGLLMYALFGTLTTADYLSAKKHTLTLQESVQATSLSLFMKDPIADTNLKTLAYANAMINSFELNVELGELIKATTNLIAKRHTDYTEQTPSYSEETKFAHQHLTFKVAANSAGLDAASKINLQSLSLRVNKNAIRENALGTVQPVDILNKMIDITGTIRLTYEDRVYRDYMLDGTKKAIRIDIVNPDVTIGSTNPSLRIDLPVVHFDAWEPNQPLEEIAEQEITFQALYDVANSRIISDAYVINEQASY